MIKSLLVIGNSKGIILPSTLLKLMEVDKKKDKLYLSYDGTNIIIRKAKKGDEFNV